MSQLKAALQPALANVNVKLKTASDAGEKPSDGKPGNLLSFKARGTENVQIPLYVPPIFSGERFVVYFMNDSDENPPTAVTITADSADGPLESKSSSERGEKFRQTLSNSFSFLHQFKQPPSKSRTETWCRTRPSTPWLHVHASAT